MELEPRYPEELAKRILSRAIEVDYLGGTTYTPTELRDIAAETGISPAALEQALREMTPADPERRRFRMVLAATVGGVVGVGGGIVDATTYIAAGPLAMGALLMVAGGSAVAGDYRSAVRGLISFQARNGMLWLTYGGAWGVTAAVAGGADAVASALTLGTAAMGWSVSSALGGVVASLHAVRNRTKPHEDAPLRMPVRQRIAGTLKRWIDLWAQRVALRPRRA